MQSCVCGRCFGSAAALAQHWAAKHGSQLPVQQQVTISPGTPARNPRSRDILLWKGLVGLDPVATVDAAKLQPCKTPVSISTPSQLVCSYNWQSTGGLRVPGHAPIWQKIALPITLPRDYKVSTAKPTFTTTRYPFEQVFRATAVVSPDFRFNEIDIVTTRNSLRKFLDFCAGRKQNSFRVHLSLVENTMFIEQYNVINMAWGRGWGHSFEKAFTRYPDGLEKSTAHDRFLRYHIGDLNCVVGFEVDACYEGNGGESTQGQGLEELQDEMGKLSLGSSAAPARIVGECLTSRRSSQPPQGSRIMPQSTAAELKTCKPAKSGIAAYLPQLWFGRTSWLIVGSHNDGIVVNTKITYVNAQLTRWETERQGELRKLATFLAELRTAVRNNGGTKCALIYEKAGGGGPNVIRLIKMSKAGKVLPEDVLGRFWS